MCCPGVPAEKGVRGAVLVQRQQAGQCPELADSNLALYCPGVPAERGV